MSDFEEIRQKKIDEICEYRKEARKNRALLCYKYDALKFKMNVLQVMIIIISTMITFLEAIKTHYDFDETSFNVATITMSTMVAFIMAIYRFFRIEENKETIKQSLESHVLIINKLHKIVHQMDNFKLTDNNMTEWHQLELSYDGEIFDTYISTKEKFDALFSFQDNIYYKRKYKRDFLELEFTNREIQLVDHFKDSKHSEFILRLKGCLYYLFCCLKRERVDYTTFMQKAEEGKLEMIDEETFLQNKKTSGGTSSRNTSSTSTIGQTTKGETTKGQTTKGESTRGQTIKGQTTEGQTTKGQTTKGQTTKGQTTEGQTTKGFINEENL